MNLHLAVWLLALLLGFVEGCAPQHNANTAWVVLREEIGNLDRTTILNIGPSVLQQLQLPSLPSRFILRGVISTAEPPLAGQDPVFELQVSEDPEAPLFAAPQNDSSTSKPSTTTSKNPPRTTITKSPKPPTSKPTRPPQSATTASTTSQKSSSSSSTQREPMTDASTTPESSGSTESASTETEQTDTTEDSQEEETPPSSESTTENPPKSTTSRTTSTTKSIEGNSRPTNATTPPPPIGTPVAPGEIPFQVAVQLVATGELVCGGSIIQPMWILTAASCTPPDPNSIRVRAGSLLYSSGGASHEVERMVNHPHYRPGAPENDLALWKTKNRLYSALPLPSRNPNYVGLSNRPPPPGVELTSSSWQVVASHSERPPSPRLLRSPATIVDPAICIHALGIPPPPTTFCTLTAPNCPQNELGSPLHQSGVLYGVLSASSQCAGLYTEVSSHRPWIANVVVPNDELYVFLPGQPPPGFRPIGKRR